MALTRPRAYQIYDIDYKQATRVVTVSNITLSGGAPSQVDGVSLSLNDRVLVVGQSTLAENGIYYVTTVGAGSNGTWARSSDTDATGELLSGTIVMVTEGNTYADTQWKLTTNNPIVIGVSDLVFVQNYLANTISSGNSNVEVNANSTIDFSVAGVADILVVTSTGANVAGYVSATGNVTGNYFIGDGSQLTGLPDGYGNANLANIGSNSISTTGNISSGYFIGNGSQLTGITAGNSFSPIVVSGQSNVTANSSATALTYVAGYGVLLSTDDTDKSITYALDPFAIGGSFGTVTESVTTTMDLGLVTDAVTVSYDLGTVASTTVDFTSVSSNIIPSANVTYDLGNATNQWRDLYMSGNTIYIGGGTISANESGVTITSPGGAEFAVVGNSAANTVGEFGAVSATGNITGNYILGNGSQLTGISTGTGPVLINEDTVTANLTIAAGQNGFSVGPMVTADGVTVTIADGQRWVII